MSYTPVEFFQEKGWRVTSGYGKRKYTYNGKLVSDFHYGVDFGGKKKGEPVYTPYAGKVIASGRYGDAGNAVSILMDDNLVIMFFHLDSRKVKAGQAVKAGQQIGANGATGYATGPHVHFEIRHNKGALFGSSRPAWGDPAKYKPKAPKPEPQYDATHVVQRGENLTVIGKKYDLTVAEVIKLNKVRYPSLVKKPDIIQPGWKLIVTPSPDAKKIHVVARGDSMWKISQKYDVTLDALIEANPQIDHPEHIEPGWEITIP